MSESIQEEADRLYKACGGFFSRAKCESLVFDTHEHRRLVAEKEERAHQREMEKLRLMLEIQRKS